MGMTDPIADLLTRIRNAYRMHHAVVSCPASKIKIEILSVLKREGYITDFVVDKTQTFPNIIITLKYNKKVSVIQGIKRISTPGLRCYTPVAKLPKVLNGLGIAIITTSKGVLSDREARQNSVGGEVIAYVW
jgi:small subunit ribosomal protein S8